MIVTEPPKIIFYYCLSLSTWPLSNNKELFCFLCRVVPGKSLTTGSLICANPTRRRDQSTSSTLHKSSQSYIITNQVFIHKSKVFKSLNSGNKTNGRYTWEAIHRVSLLVTLLPLKLPTIWNRAKPDGVA
jgi:hypothetical protein